MVVMSWEHGAFSETGKASAPNTKSTSTTETVRGEHRFDVAGYSRKQDAGAGNVLTSATFAGGGFDWAIRYYPDGKGDDEFVSAFVRLVTPDATALALFDLRLVDRATGLPRSVRRSTQPVVFDAGSARKRERGAREFMARSELAASPYLRDDRLTVECVLDVVQETRLSQTTASPETTVEPPPPDLRQHLGALLRTQVGADVAFTVQGEAFRAHRVVLAARSPVLKAELSGSPPPAKEDAREEAVAVDGVTPLVFKTLLHFIYTDALPLPGLGDLGWEEYRELVRNLLAAVDRYAMQAEADMQGHPAGRT
ncbi:BTB/POZ and MATH domain-containing protein 4-like [Panicum miliaceum]|uniref:BTB/POZ and MATH domain-containing protein 4-like n=1 Tax=Panicum miliaceum TaxID=4540 RepID=A0A3L6RIV8_PANMI|nr:BTB/POZ and MATH domain-containing protein 4-like [Panicum miliaceum]